MFGSSGKIKALETPLLERVRTIFLSPPRRVGGIRAL